MTRLASIPTSHSPVKARRAHPAWISGHAGPDHNRQCRSACSGRWKPICKFQRTHPDRPLPRISSTDLIRSTTIVPTWSAMPRGRRASEGTRLSLQLLAVVLGGHLPDLHGRIQSGQEHGDRCGPGEPSLVLHKTALRPLVLHVPGRPALSRGRAMAAMCAKSSHRARQERCWRGCILTLNFFMGFLAG